eukprot:gene10231-2384_t
MSFSFSLTSDDSEQANNQTNSYLTTSLAWAPPHHPPTGISHCRALPSTHAAEHQQEQNNNRRTVGAGAATEQQQNNSRSRTTAAAEQQQQQNNSRTTAAAEQQQQQQNNNSSSRTTTAAAEQQQHNTSAEAITGSHWQQTHSTRLVGSSSSSMDSKLWSVVVVKCGEKVNGRVVESLVEVVDNRPFDEIYEIDDSEEIDSNIDVSPPPSHNSYPDPSNSLFEPGNTPPRSPSTAEPGEYDGDVTGFAMESSLGLTENPSNKPDVELQDDSDSASVRSGTSSELDESAPVPKLEGAYDPAEYSSLNVPEEVSDLFQYITSFEPESLELETRLKPFIPEYIPAVGDIDAFLKIPRPDNVEQGLGLVVLDEPCAAQSDATVLDLHLRTLAKTTTSRATKLNQIKNAEEDTKAIDNWVRSISEVHRDRQPQSVHYTSSMPDLESLMQEWPPEMEAALDKVQLPSGDLNVSLQEMTDISCALLDIPVQKSRIESLHLLFSLFAEFKNSQHFRLTNGDEDDSEGIDASTSAM